MLTRARASEARRRVSAHFRQQAGHRGRAHGGRDTSRATARRGREAPLANRELQCVHRQRACIRRRLDRTRYREPHLHARLRRPCTAPRCAAETRAGPWANHAVARRHGVTPRCEPVTRIPLGIHFRHVMPRAAERRDGSAALSPVLRVSLAGILSTMADAVDESAFESLVDVFECYVRTIGSVGSQAAQHAGRTHANPSDALLGLSAGRSRSGSPRCATFSALLPTSALRGTAAPAVRSRRRPSRGGGSGGVEGARRRDGRRTSPTTCRPCPTRARTGQPR